MTCLLQHSDVTLQLVIWGERLKGEDQVPVSLGQSSRRARSTIRRIGTDVQKTLSGVDSLDLTLSDHPLVITLASK